MARQFNELEIIMHTLQSGMQGTTTLMQSLEIPKYSEKKNSISIAYIIG